MNVKQRDSIFYGWLVVAAAFFIQMAAWGTFNTFGVFFAPLSEECGSGRAITAGAFSFAAILRGVFSMAAGRLNDKYSARAVVTIGGLFIGLGYLFMSQVRAVWQVYFFLGVMVNLGMSASFVPVATTVAQWFVKRRGTATAIFLSGAGVGSIIMVLLSSWIISFQNWRTGYMIIAIISSSVFLLGAQLLRSGPGKRIRVSNVQSEGEGEPTARNYEGISAGQTFRTREFWFLCAIIFCGMFSLFTVNVHIVPYVIDLGFTAVAAGTILAIAAGLSFLGRILLGLASDRMGNKKVVALCFIILLPNFVWLKIVNQFWMLCVFSVIFGLTAHFAVVLSSPMVAELCGLRSHGTVLGAVTFCGSLGGASGPLLAGYIFDVTGSYQMDIMVCAVLSGVGILLTLGFKPDRRSLKCIPISLASKDSENMTFR